MKTKILYLQSSTHDAIDFIKLIGKMQQNSFWNVFLACYRIGDQSWHCIAQSLLTAQRFVELDGCGIDPPKIAVIGRGNLADYFKSISKFCKEDHKGEFCDMRSIQIDYTSNSGKMYQYIFSFDKYGTSHKVELNFPDKSELSHWENDFWETFLSI